MAGTSAARVDANRINARKSTGPKSAEGKARSRANAVKHGLTGAGVALPTEDAAMVRLRFVGLQEDMAPSDLMSRVLVGQVALMSVRIERAARRETAAPATRMRHASEEFELDRLGQVDQLFDAIEADPREYRRRLLAQPEGVDKLIGALLGVKAGIANGTFRQWDAGHRAKVDAFLGGSGPTFPTPRPFALIEAIGGDFHHLGPDEYLHFPSRESRLEWACGELIQIIDAEIAKLAALRAGFDLDSIERERLEAADRAMFDPGPEAILARKYEGAATRHFFRALREFRENEAKLAEADADTIPLFDDDSPPLEAPRPVVQADIEDEPEPVATGNPPVLQNEPNLGTKSRTPEAIRQNEPNLAAKPDVPRSNFRDFQNEPNPPRWVDQASAVDLAPGGSNRFILAPV